MEMVIIFIILWDVVALAPNKVHEGWVLVILNNGFGEGRGKANDPNEVPEMDEVEILGN